MTYHTPIMVEEIIAGLQLKPGDHVLDGTVGDGGHTEKFLEIVGRSGEVVGLDQDPKSLARAKERLTAFSHSLTLIRGNFRDAETLIPEADRPFNAILLDLGWSSSQLTDGQGLSFMTDAPLDMRLDSRAPRTAADILDKEREFYLGQMFRQLGGERYWRRIAAAIVKARAKKRITTTAQLVKIIEDELGSGRQGGIHPATRVFQALRIAVNDELESLKLAIPQLVSMLAPGGRIAILTFHSLEDKIVKLHFAKHEELEVITPKPLEPTDTEIQINPRSRSAKLRIAEKI